MQETRPAKSDVNWPIVHLNNNALKSTTLLNGSGGRSSHWITGYHLDGVLLQDDGFQLLRRNCVHFDTTDTWSIAHGGTKLDWGTKDASGHFALEVWVYIPTATGAHATLMKRGNEASDGWLLEVTSAGLVKFTAHDSADAVTITGTTSIFGGWHLITVVCERNSTTGLQIYIDGIADGTAVTTVDMDLDLDGGTTVVSTGVSNKDTWLGPVGMYIGSSANLSAATVLANYNEGIGRKYDGSETGLSLAWNNDEGSGTACYEIGNNTGYVVTVTAGSWSPTKQSGGTAAVKKCGPPFRKQYEDDAENPLPAVGLFQTATVVGSSDNVLRAIAVTFPQAIEIGRNNPVRILQTDGAFSLILHGFTADS